MTPSRTLKSVRVSPLSPDLFAGVLSPEQLSDLNRTIERAQATLAGRVVWSVNSTMRGGGVAEMLASLIAYTRGAGVDARWLVVRADPRFFELTKRLHNMLHGADNGGRPFVDEDRRLYSKVCAERADEIATMARAQDIVLLHDPQTAGMVEHLKRVGATVIWRSHIGTDFATEGAEEAWAFLLPHLKDADAYVFSRSAFVPAGIDRSRVAVIRPSIDVFSPKNQEMDEPTVTAVVRAAGLEDGPETGAPLFRRLDGTVSRVDHRADLSGGAPPPVGAPAVTQVSRWDRLKDPAGVVEGFRAHVAPSTGAHLLLAGPDVRAVADDPEGVEVLEEVTARRDACPPDVRERVHLASLPMDDTEENAAIVNALQRRAAVIVQKSLAEGFGLTVAEAMWKGRPVVAGDVGGIREQISDGETGMLVDPTDLEAFGQAVVRLLEAPDEAAHIGTRAREGVRGQFLGPRHLGEYVDLFERLADDQRSTMSLSSA